MERFNRLWRRAPAEMNFDSINKIREGYNRYYLLEKECAVGAACLSRQEFRRLELVTPEMMLREFPTLPIPFAKR